ncbi:hypothetical protein ACFX2B_037106 [Malus domestica]
MHYASTEESRKKTFTLIEATEVQRDDEATKYQLQQADKEDGVQTNALADEIGWKPEEGTKHIILDPQQQEKTARISSHLRPKENEKLMVFLRENHDIVVWSPSDMLDIDPEIACHKLHVDPAAKLVIQMRIHFAPDRSIFMRLS